MTIKGQYFEHPATCSAKFQALLAAPQTEAVVVQRACLAMAAIATRGGADAIRSFTSQAVQLARNACDSGDQVSDTIVPTFAQAPTLLAINLLSCLVLAHARLQSELAIATTATSAASNLACRGCCGLVWTF